MTKYGKLFNDLAEEFGDKGDIKVRAQAGRQLQYITARTAMNRLDNVLGPENWWDEYHAMENSVLCRLTIRLPDGSTLTKADAGGYAGMADEGDDDKSGYSDAFKRACVKFGVARYLYRDGVPRYREDAGEKTEDVKPDPRKDTKPEPAKVQPSTATTRQVDKRLFEIPPPGKPMFAWVKGLEEYFQCALVNAVGAKATEKGFGSNFLVWTEAQVFEMARDLILHFKEVSDYKGEFDHIDLSERAPAPTVAQANEAELRPIKDAVMALFKGISKKRLGRDATVSELKSCLKEFSTVAETGDGKQGVEMESLAKCFDKAWILDMKRHAELVFSMIANEAEDEANF